MTPKDLDATSTNDRRYIQACITTYFRKSIVITTTAVTHMCLPRVLLILLFCNIHYYILSD